MRTQHCSPQKRAFKTPDPKTVQMHRDKDKQLKLLLKEPPVDTCPFFLASSILLDALLLSDHFSSFLNSSLVGWEAALLLLALVFLFEDWRMRDLMYWLSLNISSIWTGFDNIGHSREDYTGFKVFLHRVLNFKEDFVGTKPDVNWGLSTLIEVVH